MTNDDKLTKQELEELAQAYLDCRLSRLQEKELELVLASQPEISSPIIDEVRETMEIMTGIEGPAQDRSESEAKGRRRTSLLSPILRWSVAAACLIMLISGGIFLLFESHREENMLLADNDTIAIIDGKVLTGEEARIATLQIRKSLQLEIDRINGEYEEINDEIQHIYTEINNYNNSIILQ